METHDVFNNACCSCLLDQALNVEQRCTVPLEVLLGILRRDAEPLELADDAHLRRFVLDDDVAWLRIGFGGFGALDDGLALAHGTVGNPPFDDDVT